VSFETEALRRSVWALEKRVKKLEEQMQKAPEASTPEACFQCKQPFVRCFCIPL
jgi:predicted ATP-grasp superfamily ATP-dependent carboligase